MSNISSVSANIAQEVAKVEATLEAIKSLSDKFKIIEPVIEAAATAIGEGAAAKEFISIFNSIIGAIPAA